MCKCDFEKTAFRSITGALGNAAIQEEMLGLWLEFEDGSTPESDVARQLDKYEMVVQADEYERAQGRRLDDFFRSTENYFTHPEVSYNVWCA